MWKLKCLPLLLAEFLEDGQHGSKAVGIRPPYPANLHFIRAATILLQQFPHYLPARNSVAITT